MALDSFPSSSSFNDFPYKVTLAFLNGANTISKISEATNTELTAETYLKHIRDILGDVSGAEE